MSNWAKKVGIGVVTSHIGFIPIDATSLQYKGFIETMKSFVSFCKANGQMFAFETKPMEAVEALGEFVVNTHIKDGKWPAEPGKIGQELPLGEGDVHYEEVIPALYKKGFRGYLTIEREISGEKQIEDIKKAIKILEEIKAKLR
jgi:sugar phosphate isomerase/epimerase